MSEGFATLAMLGLFLLALASGLSVAWSLGGVATLSAILFLGPQFVFPVVSNALKIMDNFVLIAVPLFIVMAMILDKSDIISDLFETAYKWSGGLRGGVAVGVVIACTIFAACTGIVAGAIIAMGVIALPIMLKYKYSKDIALGSILAGGTLGQLIPPSIVAILYASFTNVSVGALFAGGMVAGFVLSGLYIIYILVRSAIQKNLCPALPLEARATWKEKFLLLKKTILPILLILAVLGSIYSGAATPTEAAAVGTIGAAICAAVKRKFTWPIIKSATTETIKTTGMIGWILIASMYFASVFTAIGGGALIENLIKFMPGGSMGGLLLMVFILFLLGMVIDVTAIIVVAGPIFAPIAVHLGFNPIWFGIVFIVLLQTGYISPPFGWSLFYLEGVVPKPDITLTDIYRSSWAFLGLQVVGAVIFIAFPGIVLWLPNLILG